MCSFTSYWWFLKLFSFSLIVSTLVLRPLCLSCPFAFIVKLNTFLIPDCLCPNIIFILPFQFLLLPAYLTPSVPLIITPICNREMKDSAIFFCAYVKGKAGPQFSDFSWTNYMWTIGLILILVCFKSWQAKNISKWSKHLSMGKYHRKSLGVCISFSMIPSKTI